MSTMTSPVRHAIKLLIAFFATLSRNFNLKKAEDHTSCVMKKTDFCICENKDEDQLRGNREADQHLCFRYTDSTIPLLSKSEISNL